MIEIKKPQEFLKITKTKLQMLNSNTTNAEELRIYQIIDANLDRAREGLRVLEDWARFGLGNENMLRGLKILGKFFREKSLRSL